MLYLVLALWELSPREEDTSCHSPGPFPGTEGASQPRNAAREGFQKVSGVDTEGQGGVTRLSDQTSCSGGAAGKGVNVGQLQSVSGHTVVESTGRMRQSGAGGGSGAT